MKRQTLTIFLIFSTGILCDIRAQKPRHELDSIVTSIAFFNRLDDEAIGLAGETSEQWERYSRLNDLATESQLITLTDHTNPVVRCYSFLALALRNQSDILPILIRHLNDTTIVETYEGCSHLATRVGDYFLDVVTPTYVDINAYKLTSSERVIVDSILIFEPNITLRARSEVLLKIKPEEKYYERVRRIYLDEGDNYALVAMSKFRNPNDVEFIESALKSDENGLYYALLAVRNFPDIRFFPILKEIQDRELAKSTRFDYSVIRTLYQAIVQYQDEQSKKLLELAINSEVDKKFGYHSDAIWLALEKFPSLIYEDISHKLLWSEYRKMKFQFWLDHPER